MFCKMEIFVFLLSIFFYVLSQCSSIDSYNNITTSGVDRYPVILVPGDGGSQFEARLNKTESIRFFCAKQSDWFSLWLNLELLAPLVLDCFVDNMKLKYNNKTRKTSNNDGVETRQPGFGSSSSVEWLDPSEMSPTSYFYYIAQALESWGFKRDVSIRGAPYDFRKAPNEMSKFVDDLQHLIEDTYIINGHRRVVLIGHSMGNPYILYLLNRQSRAWKDKFVKSFVSLAAPWAGAAKTMRLMTSGDDLDVFVVKALTVRPLQRSIPSSAWLLPYDTFWDKDEVIATSPYGNYTVSNYKKFFQDINFSDGYDMRQDTEHLGLHALKPPEVEIHCLHGAEIKTPEKFHWSAKQFPDYPPTTEYGPGDGTVNLRSLRGCLKWNGHQKQKVHHQEFNGTTHMTVLYDKNVIEYIKSVVHAT